MKIIGTVFAFAGSAIVAWGLHDELTSAYCRFTASASCDPSPELPIELLFPVGLVLAVIGGFMDGKGVFTMMSAGVATASLLAWTEAPPDKRTFPLIFGAAFGVVAVVLALGSLMMRPIRAHVRREAERLVTEGRRGVATITEVADTGVTVNHNPRVRLTYRIDPADGSMAFHGERSETVSRVRIPRPGDRYPVWFDPDDHDKLIFEHELGRLGMDVDDLEDESSEAGHAHHGYDQNDDVQPSPGTVKS